MVSSKWVWGCVGTDSSCWEVFPVDTGDCCGDEKVIAREELYCRERVTSLFHSKVRIEAYRGSKTLSPTTPRLQTGISINTVFWQTYHGSFASAHYIPFVMLLKDENISTHPDKSGLLDSRDSWIRGVALSFRLYESSQSKS